MHIPDESIGRLFVYLRALICLSDQDLQTVSSKKIGESCGVKPSVIRKDLSYFGAFGKHGVGYEVDRLIKEIRSILNLDRVSGVALVGAGNIGTGLLGFYGFRAMGVEIVVAFDNDPEKIGKEVDGIPIKDVAELEKHVSEKDIKLAIICVPVSEAPQMAHRLADAGVKGILSFSPCPQDMPSDVKVTCADLSTQMARLVYHV